MTLASGIECNSLHDPNSQFHKIGQRHFNTQRNSSLVGFLSQIFDDTARFLGVKQLHDDVSEFFMKIVVDTIKYREENNISRNDFMDILLKLKNQENAADGDKNSLTVNEIAAQAFVFFIGKRNHIIHFENSGKQLKMQRNQYITGNPNSAHFF